MHNEIIFFSMKKVLRTKILEYLGDIIFLNYPTYTCVTDAEFGFKRKSTQNLGLTTKLCH